jgi:PEP-CTERM motif
MSTFRRSVFASALFACTTLLAHAAAPIVTNGSLTSAIANDGVPAGWLVLEGSPDVMDAHDNVGLANTLRFGASPDASPDGGTWVGLGRYEGYTERFGQVLNGLSVGQTYTVSWLAGNFGYTYGSINYLGSNAIDVWLDCASIGAGATHALGSQWFGEALTFTASAASQQLSFTLATSQKAYLSIDGIVVTKGGSTTVPEPGSLPLLGLGLIGLCLVARRQA